MIARFEVPLVCAFVAAAFASQEAEAQWVTSHGPAGATVTSFVRSANGTSLFAGTNAGVFRAAAGYAAWNPASTGLTNTDVLSLAAAVNWSGGELLMAGTREGGVFASWNDGAGWTAVNSGLTNGVARAVAAIPDPYFGYGMVLFAGTDAGLFRSNGGQNVSWVPRNGGLTSPLLRAFVWIPGGDENDGIGAQDLYAGTAGGGAFLSNDGVTWWPKNTGLTNTNVAALAAMSAGPFDGTLFAGTVGGGVFRSSGGLGGWTAVNDGLTNPAVQALAATGTLVFAGTNGGGVFVSGDAGETWEAANDGLPDLSITALVSDGTHVLAATGAGVYRRPLADFGEGQPVSVGTEQDLGPRLILTPNPMRDRLAIVFALELGSDPRVDILDAGGRRVRRLIPRAHSGARIEATWDGRDDRGAMALPGIYWVACRRDDGALLTARFVLVR